MKTNSNVVGFPQQHIRIKITGNSLIDKGVQDGDYLICRTNPQLSQIKNKSLVLVKLNDGTEIILEFHQNSNHQPTLSLPIKNSPITFSLEDVKILAIGERLIEDWI